MKKLGLVLGCIALSAIAGSATANTSSLFDGSGFSAPNVYNPSSNLGNPQVGDLVFDTQTSTFAGYAGGAGWLTLGSPSGAVYSGTLNDSSNNWTTTSSTLTDFTAPAGGSIVLSNVVNSNMGTPAAAGSSLPGITLTLPSTATYMVTATVNAFATSTGIYTIELVDGSGTVIAPGVSFGPVTGAPYGPITLQGLYSGTAGSTTFKIKGATSTGTLNVGQGQTGSNAPGISFNVYMVR